MLLADHIFYQGNYRSIEKRRSFLNAFGNSIHLPQSTSCANRYALVQRSLLHLCYSVIYDISGLTLTLSADKFIFSGEHGELTCFYAHRGLYSNPTIALVRMRSPVRIWLSAPQHLQKCKSFFLFYGQNRHGFAGIGENLCNSG